MASVLRSAEPALFLGVVAATAVLAWFGNGLTPWWPLMWVAPLPVLWYSQRSSWVPSAGAAFLGWWLGSAALVQMFNAQGTPFALWLLDFGALAAVFAIGVLLFRHLLRRGAFWSATLVLPALWVSVDWLRYGVTPDGTSADLAYTQLAFLPFLQLASLTGPWGMTFVLLWAPACVAAFVFLRREEPRRARQLVLVAGSVLLLILAFGTVRLLTGAQRPRVAVGLVAADAGDVIARAGADATRELGAYLEQARSLAARGAQVIVLPEKIAAVRDRDQPLEDAAFQRLADEAGVMIVAGELRITDGQDGVRRYNRAQVYTPHSSVATYDKRHMLPPFESHLVRGTKSLLVRHPGAPLGVAICKDMDFTSTSLAYGKLRAGMMLVPAWDFVVDAVWHGHMAIMRGVEGGFSVARAARAGYLTVSDDRGRILAEARSGSTSFATLLARVPVGPDWTLFQAWGNWFAWLCVALLGVVLGKWLLLQGQAAAVDRPGRAEPLKGT